MLDTATALPDYPMPDARDYSTPLRALLASGQPARDIVVNEMPVGAEVAIDIETPSVTDSFTIKCVTAAWEHGGQTVAVILDPSRNHIDALCVRRITERAGILGLHNGSFDVPSLVVHGLMARADIEKVLDLIVFARSAWPDEFLRKDLASVAKRVLPGIAHVEQGLQLAMKAGGYSGKEDWFGRGDIHVPYYRTNAMADTIITLRAMRPAHRAAVDRQLDHPFEARGMQTRGDAEALVHTAQQMNRWALRRASDGYAVDLDYLDTYRDRVGIEIDRSSARLSATGLRPGNAIDLMTRIDRDGALPPDWPRTEKTGRLSATKEHLEDLPDHPLVLDHRVIMDGQRMINYLEKTVARSRPTGRLHPQINILGASKSGRMSIGEPELQQFPKDARPIILADPGRSITSVDWSSIEPALLGWMSNDRVFMGPFEGGADIYQPIVDLAGIVRDKSKTVLLGDMYGLGGRKLALKLGTDIDTAKQYRTKIRSAMPVGTRHMEKIKRIAERYALTITLSGRVLTVPRFNGEIAAYKAVNFTFQGSCYDLISRAILEAERQGFGHLIYIPMHDEITCDSAIGPDIQQIMQTPWPEFARWCEWTPRIRTDLAVLGGHWAKPA